MFFFFLELMHYLFLAKVAKQTQIFMCDPSLDLRIIVICILTDYARNVWLRHFEVLIVLFPKEK